MTTKKEEKKEEKKENLSELSDEDLKKSKKSRSPMRLHKVYNTEDDFSVCSIGPR